MMGEKTSDATRDRVSVTDRRHIQDVLRGARGLREVPDRIEWISRFWIGYPFRDAALGGGPDIEEEFSASVDGFDCVTYVESVLAMAMSDSVTGYLTNLRRLRYRNGKVGWGTRNHYMIGWIRANARAGFIRNQTRGPRLVDRERRLSVVPGLPTRNLRVTSIPKREFCRRFGEVETGDLIFFASTRRNLDIFHCGILIRNRNEPLIRHAARSRGRVVEQPLVEFLEANRMAGVLLVRPQDVFPRAA